MIRFHAEGKALLYTAVLEGDAHRAKLEAVRQKHAARWRGALCFVGLVLAWLETWRIHTEVCTTLERYHC